MPKKRERSSEEYFRGILREKEKIIKALQRRIRHLEKREHIYDQVVDDLVDGTVDINNVEPTNKCPNCKSGELRLIDLKYVVIETCDNDECGYKKKRKA